MEGTESAFLGFPNRFLNQIIYHSIKNDDFLRKIRSVVPLDIFKVREKRALMECIYDYWDEYRKAPQENFIDVFEQYADGLPSDLVDRCVDLLDVLAGITGSNAEYILTQIRDAIQHFKMEEAIVECAALVKKGKYDEVKPIILRALQTPEELEKPYYDFLADQTFIESRINGPQYRMVTRIPDLDKMVGGFKEKWLVTLLGATKGGKTWWLIEMALSAMLQGLNVLFISLEMGKEQIDERFDMAISFASSFQTSEGQETMRKGPKEGEWVKTKEPLPSIYNIDLISANRRKLAKISHGGLRIMAFNRGRVNYMDVDTVLDELVEQEGWVADVVVVDYLGIMKDTAPQQSKKERIGENCIGLKEIAAKRNLIVISAMQGNRKAMQSETFQSHMVADDIDTIFNSDLVLAICQTKLEEKDNKYRLYIANYRHGKQHGMIGMVRDLNIGQVCVGTYPIIEKAAKEDNLNAGVDM